MVKRQEPAVALGYSQVEAEPQVANQTGTLRTVTDCLVSCDENDLIWLSDYAYMHYFGRRGRLDREWVLFVNIKAE